MGDGGWVARAFVWGVAGFLALACFIGAWIAQIDTVKYRRLRRGVDELARWRVNEAEWRAFLAFVDRLNRQSAGTDVWSPAIARRDAARPGGVEVIVGRTSLIVGDDFETLPAGPAGRDLFGPDWLDGPPPCLEFRIRSQTSEGSGPDTMAIRVPIAAGAEGEARAVLNYYHRREQRPTT